MPKGARSNLGDCLQFPTFPFMAEAEYEDESTIMKTTTRKIWGDCRTVLSGGRGGGGVCSDSHTTLVGSLSKHDGDGRRERQKTKALISKTMTPHVCYTFWYISLLFCAQLQRGMTKLKVCGEREFTTVNFRFSP